MKFVHRRSLNANLAVKSLGFFAFYMGEIGTTTNDIRGLRRAKNGIFESPPQAFSPIR